MVMTMNRNSIRWRLPASYGVIALLAALSLGSVMLLVLKSYYAQQEQDYLLRNALALQPIIERALQSDMPPGIVQDQINGLAFLSQTQIRVLHKSGAIIADSGKPEPEQVVAVSGASKREIPFFGSGPASPSEDRMPIVIYSKDSEGVPEVLPFDKEIPYSGPAPDTDVILSVSASPYGYVFVSASQFDTTRRSSEVASTPLIATDGSLLGRLEFSNGPSYGADIMASVSLAWLVASVIAVAIAALTGWFMSRRVTRPVLALENATRQMERGDLAVRVNLPHEKQQEFLSLASSFNGMAEQVEQTVSTLRAFVADAAHELHTPLTALQTNLELAGEEKNASARTRYLSRAQDQGQRLEALVNSLLDLSRIEAAESKAGFLSLDLVQVVREVSEPFASRAEQTDRAFRLTFPGERMPVSGNEAQLRQVIVNLLENAFKFTPEGGWVSLSLGRDSDRVMLTVADSGIGIPSDDLPHIFERFHRGRNVAEYAGNGLGLAIVKAIAEAHSGRVEVQSPGPGEGSTFQVSLPLYENN